MDKYYYLMDLERSILDGDTTYWRFNKRGYTRDIEEAGLYLETEANEIVKSDFFETTVMIPESVVKRLISKG